MATITARKLSRDTASVIDELATSGEPVLIVRKGQPVAVLSAVDPARVEDVVLASAPEFTRALARADDAAAAGETETFEEIFAEGHGDVGEQGEDETPAADEYEPKFDPVVLDALAGTVVRRVSYEAAETPGEIPAERLERIHELSRSLARRMLARNIDQTLQMVTVLSTSMIGAGELASAADDDRFDQILDTLGESAGLVSSEDG